MVALKQAESCCQQTGVVIEHGGEQCDQQPLPQILALLDWGYGRLVVGRVCWRPSW